MDRDSDRTVLLLGGTGQIGHALRATLDSLGQVEAPDRQTLDLAASAELRAAVRSLRPDVVVNAAAYTAVDDAEENYEAARALNVQAPRVLAEAAAEVGGLLVHYSTDYVFDGTKRTPYVESDDPNPINEYGRTKWNGETAIQDIGRNYLILRTSWVYSRRRSNFLLSMLRLAEEHETLTVVDDQIGTPTWAGWIAEATATILERVLEDDAPNGVPGLYHLAASGQTSWYGFARAIFAQFGPEDVTVKPIPSDEYPTQAPRPLYTALSSRAVVETFGIQIPTWTEQLATLRSRIHDRSRLL